MSSWKKFWLGHRALTDVQCLRRASWGVLVRQLMLIPLAVLYWARFLVDRSSAGSVVKRLSVESLRSSVALGAVQGAASAQGWECLTSACSRHPALATAWSTMANGRG